MRSGEVWLNAPAFEVGSSKVQILPPQPIMGTKMDKVITDHSKCRFSTGICGGLTAGQGKLDIYGYWEMPCPICLTEMLEKIGIEDNEVVGEPVEK